MGTQFETFDGAKFAFNDMGGRFSLVEPAPGNTDKRADIRVFVQSNLERLTNENDDSSYVNLPKIVIIRYNGIEISLKSSSLEFGDNPTNVVIAGEDYTNRLPFENDDKDIQVSRYTDIYTGVRIGSQFMVAFDGRKTVTIIASNALKNKVRTIFDILISFPVAAPY